MSKVLISLGGNALGKTPSEQKELLKIVAKSVVDMVKLGHQVILTHGNGPQVGMINLAFENGSKDNNNISSMPLPECGAMSQGYIGYHMQNAIRYELLQNGIDMKTVSLVTQVLVDEKDAAFSNPTKPIGSFYSKEEAKALEKEKGYIMVEDASRGYRRVVASPKPIDVIEKDTIETLVNSNHIVITVGGGGIPVIKQDNKLIGVDAVIDKDLASAKVADLLNVDYLYILTAVDNVYINFGKENEKALSSVTTSEIKNYIKDNQFAKGSMLPKVEACIDFVEKGSRRTAVIASLNQASPAFKQKAGTIITR